MNEIINNKYPIYVAGDFVDTATPLKVLNSFSGDIVAETFIAGKAELDLAIEKALKAKKIMAALPAFERYNILTEIVNQMKAKKNELAAVLSLEACKPLKYAMAEIDRAIQVFTIASEETKRLPSESLSIDWTPAGKGKEGLIKYFPLGLIAGIVPFNFPMNLAVHKIAPALASGNCIIVKPARSTPLSTLELAKIIDNTQLPKGAFSVLPMDRVAGQQLVTDDRFNMLTFTGSPSVGWDMKAKAGKKKVTLELGGNAGSIVTSTCDLETTVNKCVTGSFAYSGQVCIHTQRIFVDNSVFDEFISLFIIRTSKLKTGKSDDINTDISAMIDEENALRVEEWVNEALDSGAELLCGGKREKNVYLPTALTATKKSMKVNTCEVFGPVVTIEKYNTFIEAVNLINDSDFGLQASVFTNSIDEMNYAFSNIETGAVIINDATTFRVDHMPYGGVKDSGFGREGVKYAIHEMMEPKLLVKNF